MKYHEFGYSNSETFKVEYHIDDKELAEFSKNMLDGYNNYIKVEEEAKERKSNPSINRLRELGV